MAIGVVVLPEIRSGLFKLLAPTASILDRMIPTPYSRAKREGGSPEGEVGETSRAAAEYGSSVRRRHGKVHLTS